MKKDTYIYQSSFELIQKKAYVSSKDIRSQKLDVVLDDNFDWINKNNLELVILRLIAIQLHSPKKITGKAFALLAKRLIDAELEVGGPYKSTNKTDIYLNALIAQLFTTLKSPLPNVLDYLRVAINSKKKHDANLVWPIFFPNPLMKININRVVFTPTSLHLRSMFNYKKSEPSPSKAINEVASIVYREINDLDEPIRSTSLKLWRVIVDTDKRMEITNISKYFALSIARYKSNESIIATLGTANFYAWMAFTIYDDIIDKDSDSSMLPIANIFQRKSIYKYLTVSNQYYINSYYNSVDLANLQEIESYRANQGNSQIEISESHKHITTDFLAKRALGHILGPMILIEDLPNTSKLQKVNIKEALSNYLIARQLNDDMHDWVEDLSKGRITFVVSYLINNSHVQEGSHSINDLKLTLKKYFWQEGMKNLANMTIEYIQKSKKILTDNLDMHDDSLFFEEILKPIESIASESIDIIDNHKDFYNTIKK